MNKKSFITINIAAYISDNEFDMLMEHHNREFFKVHFEQFKIFIFMAMAAKEGNEKEKSVLLLHHAHRVFKNLIISMRGNITHYKSLKLYPDFFEEYQKFFERLDDKEWCDELMNAENLILYP